MSRADKLLLGTLILGGIVAAFIGFNKDGTAMIKQLNMALPRSVRLNNPGNIVKSAIGWLGKIESLDSKFEAFGSPYYGIRAMLINMRTHHGRESGTIADMIRGWSTTDQEAYIQFVGSKVSPANVNTVYPWGHPIWPQVAWAMAWFEAGGEYYKLANFQRAYDSNAINGGGSW